MPIRKTASPAPVELSRRLFFDTNTREIVTMERLLKDYTLYMVDAVEGSGADYVRNHPEEFSFDAFVANCTIGWNGTLIEIANADRITVNPA